MNYDFIEAVKFATLKHAGQYRSAANRVKVPYIVHPLEVAQILSKNYESKSYMEQSDVKEELDNILIAAVLHDTLEDTDATEDDISVMFGWDVLKIVKQVTDDPKLDKMAQKRMQVTDMPKKCREAQLIKIADKTANMRDIVRIPPPWKKESALAYIAQAREVVKANTLSEGTYQNLMKAFWKAAQQAEESIIERDLANQKSKEEYSKLLTPTPALIACIRCGHAHYAPTCPVI